MSPIICIPPNEVTKIPYYSFPKWYFKESRTGYHIHNYVEKWYRLLNFSNRTGNLLFKTVQPTLWIFISQPYNNVQITTTNIFAYSVFKLQYKTQLVQEGSFSSPKITKVLYIYRKKRKHLVIYFEKFYTVHFYFWHFTS